jgi:hypothetical protein
MYDRFDAYKQLLNHSPPKTTTFPLKMASEAHLSVLSRLIDEVQRLQAERKNSNHNQGESLGEVGELAAAAAAKAQEEGEAHDKLMQDAFAVLGVSVA